MVMQSQNLWLEVQWLADQGFAVVVADGRGTPAGPGLRARGLPGPGHAPARGPGRGALCGGGSLPGAGPDPGGDAGWSFGGFLSALAVLARPDVFHAAVAGAPVTDWHWYDTYYTERFLGRPQDDPAVYERNSLLPLAARLSRPLLLVHGLVDDNVFAVHTLSLSGALLAAGRPHSVLPLPGP